MSKSEFNSNNSRIIASKFWSRSQVVFILSNDCYSNILHWGRAFNIQSDSNFLQIGSRYLHKHWSLLNVSHWFLKFFDLLWTKRFWYLLSSKWVILNRSNNIHWYKVRYSLFLQFDNLVWTNNSFALDSL